MPQDETVAVAKVEAVIGTDDVPTGGFPQLSYKAPCGDDVDVLFCTLSGLLHNDGQPIQGYDLDVIHAVQDRLDQLYYWAVEERPGVPDGALVERNAALVGLLLRLMGTQRPKIYQSTLRCIKQLMRHASRRGSASASLLPSVCDAIRKFPNMELLVEEGIEALVSMAVSEPEAILVSDAVSTTLQAMKALPAHLGVHRQGCLLVAALVDGARPDVEDAPAALLLVHVGVVVDYMCRAYRHQPQDTQLSAAVSHTLRVMSSFEQNREPLASHAMVVSTLRHLAEHHPFSLRTVQDAMTALSDLSGDLDRLQQRSIALSIKGLMVRTVETETLASSIALLLKFLRAGGEEMQTYMGEQQIPQVIAIALDHFGAHDAVLRDVACTALREMVVSKLR